MRQAIGLRLIYMPNNCTATCVSIGLAYKKTLCYENLTPFALLQQKKLTFVFINNACCQVTRVSLNGTDKDSKNRI